MASVQKTFLEIDGKKLPAKIYRESRKNVRASIGKRAVILRMPTRMEKKERTQTNQLVYQLGTKTFDQTNNFIYSFLERDMPMVTK